MICRYCRKDFPKRKRSDDENLYCSRDCAFADRKRNNAARFKETICRKCESVFKRTGSTQKICVSCRNEKPEYCATCGHCGNVFTSSRQGKKYCSSACSYSAVLARAKADVKERTITCAICSELFTTKTQGAAKCCSDQCANELIREYRHLRKRRQVQAFVKRVIRNRIFERDNWKCGICHRKVNPDLTVPHPLAKTIDHIIPLANGGTHEPRNVRLAHFICNSRRGNNNVAQLRLME